MTEKHILLLVVGLQLVVAVLATIAVVALAGGLYFLGSKLPPPWDSDVFAEELVDEVVESGVLEGRSGSEGHLTMQRKIVLTTGINEKAAGRITETLLLLDAEDPDEPIDLYLSTSGGWVDSAFAIIDAMETIRAPVNVHALAGCYSSGTLILCAGTGERTATANAILMVHANLVGSNGQYSFNRVSRRRFERTYRECASLPGEWFPMTGDDLYYLSPEQALDFGIIDGIREPRRQAPPDGPQEDARPTQ
jgi:ATP-dependent Clp protease protease subunit